MLVERDGDERLKHRESQSAPRGVQICEAAWLQGGDRACSPANQPTVAGRTDLLRERAVVVNRCADEPYLEKLLE